MILYQVYYLGHVPKSLNLACGEGLQPHFKCGLTSRLALRCHGPRARLSPRAMALFPKMNVGLANS